MKTAKQMADEIRKSGAAYVTYGGSDVPVERDEAILDIESMDDELIGEGTWEPRKAIISRRYYPYYRGKRNTNRSYRSWRVGGNVRSRSADYIAGWCDASVPDGWLRGVRGATAARTVEALVSLPGYVKA